MFNNRLDYTEERERMVIEQLQGRGIKNKKVLDAFRKVPRHKFIQQQYQESAYNDHPVPIGEGQTISQPYMVALMTELLELKGSEKVLEIGTGSGYQAAILAELASEVYTVERVELLAQKTKSTLAELGYDNLKVKVGDGSCGWQEHAPYDGIIVTCGAPSVPEPLKEQLAVNGRLVIPVGGDFSQVLTVIERKQDAFQEKEVCCCVFVPLIGRYGWNS
jgi:protein-L-isoaspartate(D-aspartate) O-methyltransferase